MSLLRKILFFVFLTVSASTAGYLYYQSLLEDALSIPKEGYIFDIEKGDSLNKVLAQLVSEGVLTATWPAKVYARHKKISGDIKVGEFKLTYGENVPGLFELITNNNQIQYAIQFIEGSTFKQMQLVLKEQKKLKLLLTEKSDQDIFSMVGIDALDEHLEGQFYPDTYAYSKGDTDLSILKRAHIRLKSLLKKEWSDRKKDLPLKTPYEALILASIVEKETGVPHERGRIAGVFTRRLEKRMRLQTDPTVIYGLGDKYKGNITRKHLKMFTPYNTYRINGLPPTPIAMVGVEAIHAALNPIEGDALYFVAKGDGTHAFSKTINEHNKAVRTYQLKRRSDYRSSHQAREVEKYKSNQKSLFVKKRTLDKTSVSKKQEEGAL